jgi:hypothetical protein
LSRSGREERMEARRAMYADSSPNRGQKPAGQQLSDPQGKAEVEAVMRLLEPRPRLQRSRGSSQGTAGTPYGARSTPAVHRRVKPAEQVLSEGDPAIHRLHGLSFDDLDANGDGRIDRKEWHAAVHKYTSPSRLIPEQERLDPTTQSGQQREDRPDSELQSYDRTGAARRSADAASRTAEAARSRPDASLTKVRVDEDSWRRKVRAG